MAYSSRPLMAQAFQALFVQPDVRWLRLRTKQFRVLATMHQSQSD